MGADLKRFKAENLVVPSSGLTDINTNGTSSPVILVDRYDDLVFELANTGQALTDFAILGYPHPDSANFQILISGATWGTVAGILIHKVGALNTLASAGRALARVNIGNMYAIKFQAVGASATTAVTIYGTLGSKGR